MSAKTAGTRAHTVPKFYLNGFTTSPLASSHEACLWIASLTTGEIKQRSPKNVSISRGIYDGSGGFEGSDKTIEAHLAEIESAAAPAIKKFSALPMGPGYSIPPEITRFIAWQACRTLPYRDAEAEWINDLPFEGQQDVIEPPPPGFDKIRDRERPIRLRDSSTGEECDASGPEEINAYRRKGWNVVLGRADHLELMHLQAWYFQVRHFPRLSWARLHAPGGEFFVTSDRAVGWLVDGYAGATPAALRHPKAMIIAPLTKKLALVGRYESGRLGITPREVNRLVAFLASDWVAGPTRRVVEQALSDHQMVSIPESNWLLALDRLEDMGEPS